VVARILRILPEELRLQGEHVIEYAVDPPSLEPVIRDDTGAFEMAAQRSAQRTVDS